MKLQRHWIVALAVITVLWTGVALVYHATEDDISFPEKTLGLMSATPWLKDKSAVLSTAARAQHVDLVVRNMNMLNFEQRREVREDSGDTLKRFFDSLTEPERKDYVDRTVQKAFDAVIKGFNAMAPEERKSVVNRVRRDIRANRNGEEAQKRADDDQKLFDEFIDIGIEDYLKNASTDEKMKLAPAIEDMQTRIRSGGR